MRFARQHCYYGWLFLEPADYRRIYNQLILMRDADLKRGDTSSGFPTGFAEWCEDDLKELAKQSVYKKRINEHLDQMNQVIANRDSVTSLVAEKYTISRRRARQIASSAYLLLKEDVEEGDLNRPEMTAKILCVLENAMFQAMQKKQYAAVAANAKVLMRLIGLDTQEVNHNHGFKHGRTKTLYP
jgi:hypothetical protein